MADYKYYVQAYITFETIFRHWSNDQGEHWERWSYSQVEWIYQNAPTDREPPITELRPSQALFCILRGYKQKAESYAHQAVPEAVVEDWMKYESFH